MASTKFATGMQRLMPWLGYHHILMIILAASIIFTSLTLAGCSSYSTMTGIYVLDLSYSNGTAPSSNTQANANLSGILTAAKGGSRLEVRAGYFGYCVRDARVNWICSSDGPALLDQFGPDQDPLNIIWTMNQFQSRALFSGLMFMTIALAFLAITLLATFPGWHYEHDPETGTEIDVKPFPSRPVAQIALAFCLSASVFGLIATLWQHTGAVAAASAIRSVSYGNVEVTVGAVSLVLMWMSSALLIIVTIGLLVMLLSMSVLDMLTED